MIVRNPQLTVNEIFYSIQGESYLAGLPCVFVRLTACDLRCVYCDTEYAFHEGRKMTCREILLQVQTHPCRNILITGGEPLLQSSAIDLMQILVHEGYSVALETGGHRDLSKVPGEVVIVMDLKTPASGECEHNRHENLRLLKKKDEVKFVVMNDADIDWALAKIREHGLVQRCHVSLSPTHTTLHPVLAQKILTSGLMIRQQTQLHKIIWPERVRGV